MQHAFLHDCSPQVFQSQPWSWEWVNTVFILEMQPSDSAVRNCHFTNWRHIYSMGGTKGNFLDILTSCFPLCVLMKQWTKIISVFLPVTRGRVLFCFVLFCCCYKTWRFCFLNIRIAQSWGQMTFLQPWTNYILEDKRGWGLRGQALDPNKLSLGSSPIPSSQLCEPLVCHFAVIICLPMASWWHH